MYICFSTFGGLRAGDIVILEKSEEFGEVAAKAIGGGIVGFVTQNQPEGCLSKFFVENAIGRERLLGHAVVVNGNVALFQSDSTALSGGVVKFSPRRASCGKERRFFSLDK